MPSLSSGLSLGTGSVSSLVKSASTLASEIATYNDTLQAQNYALSGHTDDALTTYQSYLQGRITTLRGTGSVTDATKALDLTNTLTAAINSNITASILRENIQIMAGNATPTDKLNLISQEFTRAINIGDMTTATSLESQAYSLNQTIKEQNQTAASARDTLSSASASGEDNVATQLSDNLKQLNVDAGAAGQANLNKQLKTWVGANKTQLQALANGPGVNADTKAAIEKAINTSQPNYQDVVSGVGQAIISAHYQAYLAELPISPQTAQGYLDAARAVANGSTKLSTLAGELTLQQVGEWQSNPSMFVPHENANSGQLTFSYNDSGHNSGMSAVNGFKFDSAGNVIAAYTGQNTGTPLTKQQVSQTTATLQKLGFSFDKSAVTTGASNTNGIPVQASTKLPKFLQPILGGQQNLDLRAYVTKQGVQLATIDANGKDNIYLLATDTSGKHAVYQATGQYADGNPIFGKQQAKGDYGFNQNNNSLWQSTTGPDGKVTTQIKGSGTAPGISNVKDNTIAFLGKGDLNNMINNAQDTAAKITAARQAAFAAQAVSKPVPLTVPTLKGVQLPPQKIQPQPNAVAVAQPTVNPQLTANPQPKTGNPQSGAGSPQGGNVNPQSGGNNAGTLQITHGAGIPL